MNDEAVKFLIQQKISYVSAIANVCMWWWVSSIAFCGSILGAIWSKSDKLKERRLVIWLGIILFTFFTSIIVFGGLIILYLSRVQSEIDTLAANLNAGGFFHTELSLFRWSMGIASGSFVLVWFAWFFLWRRLLRNSHKSAKSK